MEYPIGDFLDRFAIVSLKFASFGTEAGSEYEAFNEEFHRLCEAHPEWRLLEYLASLIEVNKEIWGYERAVREGELDEYDSSEMTGVTRGELLKLAAVGANALRIRNTNRIRCRIRNELVELTGSGFKDVKVSHSSEEVTVEGFDL